METSFGCFLFSFFIVKIQMSFQSIGRIGLNVQYIQKVHKNKKYCLSFLSLIFKSVKTLLGMMHLKKSTLWRPLSRKQIHLWIFHALQRCRTQEWLGMSRLITIYMSQEIDADVIMREICQGGQFVCIIQLFFLLHS